MDKLFSWNWTVLGERSLFLSAGVHEALDHNKQQYLLTVGKRCSVQFRVLSQTAAQLNRLCSDRFIRESCRDLAEI